MGRRRTTSENDSRGVRLAAFSRSYASNSSVIVFVAMFIQYMIIHDKSTASVALISVPIALFGHKVAVTPPRFLYR